MKFIYALTDPRSRQIRYIGQTDNVEQRYKQHVADVSKTKKVAWLSELKRAGVKPGVIVLQDCEDREVFHIENWWITVAKRRGMALVNGTNPGEWRFKEDFAGMFSEHLRQMSDAHQQEIELMQAKLIADIATKEREKWIARFYGLVYSIITIFCMVAVYERVLNAFTVPGHMFPGLSIAAGWLAFPWYAYIHWLCKKQNKMDKLTEGALWFILLISTMSVVNAIYTLGGMSK